jgi:ketosteroid isomerase-like protein
MQCRVNSRSVLLIAVMAVMISLAVPAFALPRQQKRDYKQQVEALEEQWRAIQMANDVNAMDKLLSDDYIGISMTGQIYTKAQQLERMRTKKLTLTQIKFDEMKVKLIGSIAIVTSRTDIEGVNDDVPVKGTYRYTRVYRRMPSGVWKITSFEATRVPKPKQVPGEAGQPSAPQGGAEPHPPPTSQFLPAKSVMELPESRSSL